ncbi:unnamed protein product [Protopolystoma xenopodis]|uniref:Uncharacterized protein n=1 Tax=Protopolystoma xenopodis TaxID=117903 RepID=A0A448X480_9PLAT|nr:unnamed protein product [Protopolystoma xenopodis]
MGSPEELFISCRFLGPVCRLASLLLACCQQPHLHSLNLSALSDSGGDRHFVSARDRWRDLYDRSLDCLLNLSSLYCFAEDKTIPSDRYYVFLFNRLIYLTPVLLITNFTILAEDSVAEKHLTLVPFDWWIDDILTLEYLHIPASNEFVSSKLLRHLVKYVQFSLSFFRFASIGFALFLHI